MMVELIGGPMDGRRVWAPEGSLEIALPSDPPAVVIPGPEACDSRPPRFRVELYRAEPDGRWSYAGAR